MAPTSRLAATTARILPMDLLLVAGFQSSVWLASVHVQCTSSAKASLRFLVQPGVLRPLSGVRCSGGLLDARGARPDARRSTPRSDARLAPRRRPFRSVSG